MTRLADPSAPRPPTLISSRLIGRATAAVAFERLWPVAILMGCDVAIFITVSWLGVWLVLPPWAHIALLSLFVAALVASIVVGVRTPWPNRSAALARLDRDSGLPHRPISAADDSLANGGDDPSTRALWDLHRRRVAASLAKARVALPSPRVSRLDRYALRGAILVALVAAAFVAGPEKYGRLAAAFSWGGIESAPATRIDAWIDPPGYTGKPPLVLIGQARPADTHPQASFTAPVGSSVVVRAAGAETVEVTGTGALRAIRSPADGRPASEPGTLDKRFVLAGDGELRIKRGEGPLAVLALQATPDAAPRIRLSGLPKANARGTLALGYLIEDDYGVTGAEAHFSSPVVRGRPVTGRALVDAPVGVLSLPAMPGGLGEAKTTLDLSEHPWAGTQVTMALSARDEGGNVGQSAPTTLTLPAKPFSHPVARALVEQRRNLVLDPDGRAEVALALEALQIAPEAFDVPASIYLGLHSAQVRLAAAKSDADLLAVADYLWQMALQIENGDLNKTEQDLRAAQKELRDALERGASPDEIKRLTEALRRQMDKFVAEMLQNAEKDQAQNGDQPSNRDGRTITEQDLKSLMDRMDEAAKRGDMAEAQRLLDELNSIMENLKTAKRGSQSQNQATREMNRSMNDLNKMMRDQGDVRDKTFKRNQDGGDEQGEEEGSQDQAQGQGQDGSGDPQQGQGEGARKPGQSGKSAPGFSELRRRQQALGGQLDALQRKLRGLGMKGEQGLADAQEAMKQAEGALGQGQGENAVAAQGRALEGLQRGASGLSQQMAEQGGEQGQQAQGQGGEQDGEDMQTGEDLDPLGRPRQGRGSTQGRDLDVSGGLAARAQQVLQELRRRLGDPTRSQDEQDYLERLLQRY